MIQNYKCSICRHGIYCMKYRAIPHKSARESDERFFVRKRCKTADILCVFQGFTNVFLAEKIRQNPQTHLCGVAIGLFCYLGIGQVAEVAGRAAGNLLEVPVHGGERGIARAGCNFR